MIDELLPIGSVIAIKESQKKFMITGIKQILPDEKLEYDYIGVLYPEGSLGNGTNILFNHDNIEEVIFKGYESPERDDFIALLNETYEKLKDKEA